MTESSADDEAAIELLYQCHLGEFVPRRDALAKRIRKAGDRELAARVKGLSKPSVSAWAVNQVFWRHPDAIEKLVESGQRVRDAQAEGAAAVREASRLRREAVAELLGLAEGILREDGNAPGANILKRVETSFESLAAYGRSTPDPPPGRLVGDVAPPGFEVLAGMAVSSPAKRPRTASKSHPEKPESPPDPKRAELALRLTRARRELEEARRQAEAAETAHERARRAAERDLAAVEEAARRWREAVHRQGLSEERARQAALEWEGAAARVAEAEALTRRLQHRDAD